MGSLLHAQDCKGFMKHARSTVFQPLRLLTLVAAMFAGNAFADEYSDVSQLVRAGKLTEALTKADQYLAAKPKDPQMRFIKANVLGRTGKPDEAQAILLQLTRDYPELAEPWNNLAVLYAGRGQLGQAREALQRGQAHRHARLAGASVIGSGRNHMRSESLVSLGIMPISIWRFSRS